VLENNLLIAKPQGVVPRDGSRLNAAIGDNLQRAAFGVQPWYFQISEHAIADREGVVAFRGAAFRKHNTVGEMPRAVAIGMRRARRQAQLELALRRRRT
jgi:hypothetical protein